LILFFVLIVLKMDHFDEIAKIFGGMIPLAVFGAIMMPIAILGVGIIAIVVWIIWFDNHNPPQELFIQSPWFEQIIAGKKTIEGRVAPLSKYKGLVNQVIRITNGRLRMRVQVLSVQHYPTLTSYIASVGWQNCAPHAVDYEDAVRKYRAVSTGHGTVVFSDQRIQEKGGITALTIIPLTF